MQGQKPIFYGFFRSSAAWRVRIALIIKNIDYDQISIDLDKKEQQSAQYTLIHPRQVVPALVVNGVALIESLAIIEYLDEVYPNVPLLPKNNPLKRSQIIALSEVFNSSLQPYNPKWLNNVANHFVSEEKNKITGTQQWQYWCDYALPGIEKMVASSRGKYSFGDEITLADLFLYPQVEGAISKYKIDFTNYPNILAVYGNLKVLEPFEKSNPQYCPDFDPNRFQ